jgi:hypothetical protein
MQKTRVARWALGALTTGFIQVGGCVGDDSAQPSGGADSGAGTDGASSASDAPNGTDSSTPEGSTPGADAEVDAGPPCDLAKPFAAAQAVAELNTGSQEQLARLSPDELAVYFSSDRDKDASAPGALGGHDLYTATRSSRSAAFGTPIRLAVPLNHAEPDLSPTETADRRVLFFDSYRTASDRRIFRATRANATAAFDPPAEVTELTSANEDGTPYVLPGGEALYFFSSRSGSFQIYRASLAGAVVAAPIAVPGLTSAHADYSPVVTADEKTIYWASTRPDGAALGNYDVWTATRATPADPFSGASVVPNVSSTGQDFPTYLSADGCTLYLMSDRSGGAGKLDIYRARRPK